MCVVRKPKEQRETLRFLNLLFTHTAFLHHEYKHLLKENKASDLRQLWAELESTAADRKPSKYCIWQAYHCQGGEEMGHSPFTKLLIKFKRYFHVGWRRIRLPKGKGLLAILLKWQNWQRKVILIDRHFKKSISYRLILYKTINYESGRPRVDSRLCHKVTSWLQGSQSPLASAPAPTPSAICG